MNRKPIRQVQFLSKLAMIAAIVLAVPAGAARADSLQATDDAYVALGKGTNFGGNADLLVQNKRGENRALLRFDFSVLPVATVIDKASLRLWVDSVSQAGAVDLYVIRESWSEGAVSGDPMPTADPEPFASLPIDIFDAGKFVTIDITKQVLDWHANSAGNNGILLVPNAGGINVTFNSKENPQTAHQPELEVVTVATRTNLVPGGVIMAFNLSACPAGWSEYTAAGGRYLVGAATPGAAVGAALGAGENRATGAHSHVVDPPSTNTLAGGEHNHFFYDAYYSVVQKRVYGVLDGNNTAAASVGNYARTTGAAGGHKHAVNIPPFSSATAGGPGGTNAPYVQLVTCQKA